ncbi:uncharacterized protein [Macaca nemestrina]|uniref:uncharacterized protein isoform X3 n=1 Tax=Macaca nemestrina TaxID=9545 RepID=UPI0039B9B4FA
MTSGHLSYFERQNRWELLLPLSFSELSLVGGKLQAFWVSRADPTRIPVTPHCSTKRCTPPCRATMEALEALWGLMTSSWMRPTDFEVAGRNPGDRGLSRRYRIGEESLGVPEVDQRELGKNSAMQEVPVTFAMILKPSQPCGTDNWNISNEYKH